MVLKSIFFALFNEKKTFSAIVIVNLTNILQQLLLRFPLDKKLQTQTVIK